MRQAKVAHWMSFWLLLLLLLLRGKVLGIRAAKQRVNASANINCAQQISFKQPLCNKHYSPATRHSRDARTLHRRRR